MIKYIIPLILAVTACTNETTKVEASLASCLPCDIGSVHVEEIMIETQNNARECAARFWTKGNERPLFEVKGKSGIDECKIYIIQNPEIHVKED